MATKFRRTVRDDKNIHPRDLHAALSSCDVFEDQVAKVEQEFRSRIEDYKQAKVQRIPVPVKRFVSLVWIGHKCETTIWTVREAFERLSPEDQTIYERGLATAAVTRRMRKKNAGKKPAGSSPK